uniref:Uncharacterized protein n=1 Tax=Archaeoglobus fulgidus TaxID=2234 RepID=A0A7J2TIC8_ARCFL
MEIMVPEKVLFETNVYTVENDLKAKTGRVRITEERIVFEGSEEVKIIHIPTIKNLKIQKDNKVGYLISGAVLFFTSLALLSFAPRIDSFISALVFFVLPIGILGVSSLLVYWWKLTKSYFLSLVVEYGKEIKIRSKNFSDLLEIANAIELVRIGAVKKLTQKKNSELRISGYQ